MIYVTMPVMNEYEYICNTLDSLKQQTFNDFKLYICVNQPDEWWDSEDNVHKCINNQQTIEMLKSYTGIDIKIIDKSSKGNGWIGKKKGVGWARKVVMDAAFEDSDKDSDLMVTIDADTIVNEGYLESIYQNFKRNRDAIGMTVPYYHNLTSREEEDRTILRYEIYMRYYALNLYRIDSPYNFTAVGSAMALPMKSYKKVGGMTPKLSGEDFYFIQKLSKSGRLIKWNEEKVYPAARFSDRVFFGTGPAMIKGAGGNWESYPVYDYKLFDELMVTNDRFKELFKEDLKTPLDDFLEEQFNTSISNIWKPLRENFKTEKQFINACNVKIDGLRILQYLKSNQNKFSINKDENRLKEFFDKFYSNINYSQYEKISFENSSISVLNELRNLLVSIEEDIQKKEWNRNISKL